MKKQNSHQGSVVGEDGRVDDDESVDEAVDAVEVRQSSLDADVKLLENSTATI